MKRDVFSLPVLILTGASFLFHFALYMTIPFLALYFNEAANLDSRSIGFILGAGPLLAAFLGLIGGNLSEKIGSIRSIVIGVTVLVVVYLGFLLIKNVFFLLILGSLAGVARCFIVPVLKALFVLHAGEHNKEVLRIQYITICTGGILGPSFGMYIAHYQKGYLLMITAGLLMLFGLVMILTRRMFAISGQGQPPLTPVKDSCQNEAGTAPIHKKQSLFTEYLEVIKDIRLIFVILGGMCVFIAFSQFESIFPLALKERVKDVDTIFPMLLILNSIFGIVFQFPANWLNKRISTGMIAVVGTLFFAISFILFLYASGNIVLLITATMLFTIGEGFALPAGEILVDEIAPKERKASYFGLADLRQLGFFIGPALAGSILSMSGSKMMFLAGFVIVLIAGLIYFITRRMGRLNTT